MGLRAASTRAFHKKYPAAGAIVSVSRVGFKQDRNQAVVGVDYMTGAIGGEGYYILLSKENGAWKVSAWKARHVIVS